MGWIVLSKQRELLSLLAEAKQVLLKCLVFTEAMGTCPAEELPEQLDSRGRCLERAEEVNQRLKELCAGDGAAWAAICHTCTRAGLSSEQSQLYDASLAVKAVAQLILQNDASIRERIEQEKEKLLTKIQTVNASSSTVAGRYSKSVQTGILHLRPMQTETRA